MNPADVLALLRRQTLAVQASRAAGAAPQAALVAYVVSDALEMFFDTPVSARKTANLRHDGRISIVVGGEVTGPWTLQIEGVADEPPGEERERLLHLYQARFPDAAERQAGRETTFFRVRPTWIRLTDYRGGQPSVSEMIPVGTTWDAGRRVLETRLAGAITLQDVSAWRDGLARELARVPDGGGFKLLSDLRGFAPASLEVHKAMREVVPRTLAVHGLRPAVIDLFDERPELPVTRTRGISCTAFANVHHDEDKMRDYERRVATATQRFFTSRCGAESWLDSLD